MSDVAFVERILQFTQHISISIDRLNQSLYFRKLYEHD